MKRISSLASSFVVLGLFACGGIALTPDGEKVQVDTDNPPVQCREVGAVSAHAIGKDHEERNKTLIRNAAAQKGAEYVRLESNTEQGGMRGTAFHCPEVKEDPEKPPPPPMDLEDAAAPTDAVDASIDPPAAPKPKPARPRKPKPKPAPAAPTAPASPTGNTIEF